LSAPVDIGQHWSTFDGPATAQTAQRRPHDRAADDESGRLARQPYRELVADEYPEDVPPTALRRRDLLAAYEDETHPELEDGGQVHLNEIMRRATMAMLRLAWVNTVIASAALVIALVALLK